MAPWIRVFGPAGILALLVTSPLRTSAQTGLQIQMVSEVTAIQPGKPFYAGVFIHHEPGYHTYWKQPGIVGVPTSIKWKLPKGFTVGELEYPEPERVLMFQIKAQGYERDVVLQARIQPPDDLAPGTKVTLSGRAAWMCCAQSCHPDFKELSLTLPIVEADRPVALDTHWHPLFEKEREAYVQTSTAWKAEATEKDSIVTLTLTPSNADARLPESAAEASRMRFFTEDGWINTDEPQHVSLAGDGRIVFELRVSDVYLGKHPPATLLGIVQNDGGWLKGGTLRSMRLAPVIRRQ